MENFGVMDTSGGYNFPDLFDDYIFTPTFIKNLLKEATTSKKVELTPQEIYYTKREFETNRDSVKELRKDIELYRVSTFKIIDELLLSSIRNQIEYSSNDIFKIEWFRYMHLKVLHGEAVKLEHILKQLKMKNVVEVQDLIDEVRTIHRLVYLKSRLLKSIIVRNVPLYVPGSGDMFNPHGYVLVPGFR